MQTGTDSIYRLMSREEEEKDEIPLHNGLQTKGTVLKIIQVEKKKDLLYH